MSPHTTLRGRGMLAAGIASLAIPAGALAATAGPGATAPTAGATPKTDTAKPAPLRVQVRATPHVNRGGRVRVRGALRPGQAGRRVAIQARSRRGWSTIDRVTTRAGGRFGTSWRPESHGRYAVRARALGAQRAEAARRGPVRRVNVYRPGHASWYGPGLYGNRLGCGGTLTAGTVGVAHKSLPCGARMTLRYRGRTVRARVIDRGPYVGGREFDLTAATKRALGFPSTGTVWTTR